MAKRKNLRGLPYNLAQSYFSSLNYYNCGYMSDWLVNAAHKLNIDKATIDVLNKTIYPKELNLYPLIYGLNSLSKIIEKVLRINGFPLNYIVEAKIDVEFLNPITHPQTIYCYPYLIDKEGNQYKSKRYIENAYEKFDPFDSKNNKPAKTTFLMRLKIFIQKNIIILKNICR